IKPFKKSSLVPTSPLLALRAGSGLGTLKSLRSPKGSTQRTRGNDVSIVTSKDEPNRKARRILTLARLTDLSKNARLRVTEVN
ncbi:MAG: hypothetical protein ACRELG_16480, partial [Gemmataceae bacterium]